MARRAASPTWINELKARGYGDDIIAPPKFTQRLLLWIKNDEFHQFIINHHRAAANREDGISLLNTLGINEWGNCCTLITRKLNPLDHIKSLEAKLLEIIDADFEEGKKCLQVLCAFEEALAKSGCMIVKKGENPSETEVITEFKDHPLLSSQPLNEEAVQIIEKKDDLDDDMENPVEKFRKFIHPIIPSRMIEELAGGYHHKLWTMWSLQILAPFSIDMLMFLAGFKQNFDNPSEDAFKTECLNDALHGSKIFQEVKLDYISMSMFDARKCSSPVKCYIREKLNTGETRSDEHYKLLWNWLRPFIKCTCSSADSEANQSQCKQQILWFDQALWYMAQNLEQCFPDCDTSDGLLVAFLKWLNSTKTRQAVRALVIFHYVREMMIHGAAEFGKDPKSDGGIMQAYGDFEGPKTIERLIMPPSFTIAQTKKKTTPQKRSLNLNAPASTSDTGGNYNRRNYRGRGRGNFRGYGYRGGRGSQHGRGRGNTPQTIASTAQNNQSAFQYITPRRLFQQ